MPFNNLKNGFQNEEDFVKQMNNKKLENLPFNLHLFISDLFHNIDRKDIIKCYKNQELQKYDIIIELNNRTKRISIKKGVKNSVHNEPITEMIHFLIINNMPRNMVINFLKYHYADGTTNGKGAKRVSSSEYKKDHQQEIDEINEFINDKKNYIKQLIDSLLKEETQNIKLMQLFMEFPKILFG